MSKKRDNWTKKMLEAPVNIMRLHEQGDTESVELAVADFYDLAASAPEGAWDHNNFRAKLRAVQAECGYCY